MDETGYDDSIDLIRDTSYGLLRETSFESTPSIGESSNDSRDLSEASYSYKNDDSIFDYSYDDDYDDSYYDLEDTVDAVANFNKYRQPLATLDETEREYDANMEVQEAEDVPDETLEENNNDPNNNMDSIEIDLPDITVASEVRTFCIDSSDDEDVIPTTSATLPRSTSPKPGCSKDSVLLPDESPNEEILLERTRYILGLVSQIHRDSVYDALSKNYKKPVSQLRFWDLIPESERLEYPVDITLARGAKIVGNTVNGTQKFKRGPDEDICTIGCKRSSSMPDIPKSVSMVVPGTIPKVSSSSQIAGNPMTFVVDQAAAAVKKAPGELIKPSFNILPVNAASTVPIAIAAPKIPAASIAPKTLAVTKATKIPAAPKKSAATAAPKCPAATAAPKIANQAAAAPKIAYQITTAAAAPKIAIQIAAAAAPKIAIQIAAAAAAPKIANQAAAAAIARGAVPKIYEDPGHASVRYGNQGKGKVLPVSNAPATRITATTSNHARPVAQRTIAGAQSVAAVATTNNAKQPQAQYTIQSSSSRPQASSATKMNHQPLPRIHQQHVEEMLAAQARPFATLGLAEMAQGGSFDRDAVDDVLNDHRTANNVGKQQTGGELARRKVQDAIDRQRQFDRYAQMQWAQQDFASQPQRAQGAVALPEQTNAKRVVCMEIYYKLINIFPNVEREYIKRLCPSEWGPGDRDAQLAPLVDHILEGGDSVPIIVPDDDPVVEDANVQFTTVDEIYENLLGIFPDADPHYLRESAELNVGRPNALKDFVETKLEERDYPTREQYMARLKITEQQRQYTHGFDVKQYLSIIPDPTKQFMDVNRKCTHSTVAFEFLKAHFNRMRVSTISRAYTENHYNLSRTADYLEFIGSDLKSKRSNMEMLTEDILLLQEIAFVKHRKEINVYIDNLKKAEDAEFKMLKDQKLLLECQCCYDDECVPSKCVNCDNGHIFCKNCVINGTSAKMGEDETRINCFINCGSEFSLSVLQQVLAPTTFSILLKKRQAAEVIEAGLEGLVSCPFCHFASIPPEGDKVFKCLNPECTKESCRLCKELSHVPLKCDEVMKADKARHYIEEKMTEALARKCYKCQRSFFKEEGCNKITCVCGAIMCYQCDLPIKDYSHFRGQGSLDKNRCPLYSDTIRLDAVAVRKVAEKAQLEVMKINPNIRIDTSNLLPAIPRPTNGPHQDVHNADELPLRAQRALDLPPI